MELENSKFGIKSRIHRIIHFLMKPANETLYHKNYYWNLMQFSLFNVNFFVIFELF